VCSSDLADSRAAVADLSADAPVLLADPSGTLR